MQAPVFVTLAGALAVAVAACGLDTSGLDTSGIEPVDDAGMASDVSSSSSSGSSGGGAEGGGRPSDASFLAEANTDGPSSGDSASSACVSAVPPGWSVVAYEPGVNPCPAGYGTSHDEFSGAMAGPNACTCTCQMISPPNCTAGTLPTALGSNPGQCSTPGVSLTVDGNTCMSLGQSGGGPPTLGAYFEATGFTQAVGSCSGKEQPDSSQLSKQSVRYCDVPSASAEGECDGNAPANFAACIVSSGDVACPAGSPFTKKKSVADEESLACSPCTACMVIGQCTAQTVTFYSDNSCGTQVAQLAADGSCVPTNASGQAVHAATYSAQTSATCQASGTTATVSPQGLHTLCCR